MNIDGGNGNDVILGTGFNDTITGGAGDDTITGGLGQDVLTGGGGNDQFNFAAGTSTTGQGTQDKITDWTSADHLHFTGGATGVAGTSTNYVEVVGASDYSNAETLAGSEFAGGFKYVAVQVGNDVVVFADNGGTTHALDATDTAVVLVGRSLSDIDFTNII